RARRGERSMRCSRVSRKRRSMTCLGPGLGLGPALALVEQGVDDRFEREERSVAVDLEPDLALTVEDKGGRETLEVGDLLQGGRVANEAGIGYAALLEELTDRLAGGVADLVLVIDADDRK